jgi:soluble cytochrome b562
MDNLSQIKAILFGDENKRLNESLAALRADITTIQQQIEEDKAKQSIQIKQLQTTFSEQIEQLATQLHQEYADKQQLANLLRETADRIANS